MCVHLCMWFIVLFKYGGGGRGGGGAGAVFPFQSLHAAYTMYIYINNTAAHIQVIY